ncbi:MAG TPA: hypothetical protein VMX17_12700 [Candidatus Glassbacteria bacterium]|nr:hypothetical protein [Candidatus Glassbacteria bacterium]
MSETLIIKDGKSVEVNCGDVLFMTISPEDEDVVVKGKYLEYDGNVVTAAVLNPDLEFVDVTVKPTRIVRIEKSN